MEEKALATTLLAACLLAAVHLLAGRLRFLGGVPRSRWLSAAGGVSVAYVFAHLLPELGRSQAALEEKAHGVLAFLEDHVYLLALVGFAVFYGVEVASRRSSDRLSEEQQPGTSASAFWFSMGSFAVYNGIIGYLLLHREEATLTGLVFFALALGVHFVVNDFGLREHHAEAYAHLGRFLLAGAILAGWVVGALTEISDAAIGLLIAFIGGGVILNVVKEELPRERRARFGAFLGGTVAYAVLLQFV